MSFVNFTLQINFIEIFESIMLSVITHYQTTTHPSRFYVY